jgi:hypothetical protein
LDDEGVSRKGNVPASTRSTAKAKAKPWKSKQPQTVKSAPPSKASDTASGFGDFGGLTTLFDGAADDDFAQVS